MQDLKFDWSDVSLIPAEMSHISSRKEIDILTNNRLPIIISPMDTVVDQHNVDDFYNLGFSVCLPRNIKNENKYSNSVYNSYGLDELESLDIFPDRLLIDVANGHSDRVYNISKKILNINKNTELIVGNIANPKTYKQYAELGVCGVRLGIGGGSACTTSANAAIHYPMASLVNECYQIKQKYNYNSKIIADGGFKNTSEIIKALALGADIVMLGSIVNKAIESAAPKYKKNDIEYEEISQEMAERLFASGVDIYSLYRGMSTKSVQKSWGRTQSQLRTSEGITKYNKIEYTIASWTENFSDYLKSAMSYSGKKNLEEFTGKAEYVFVTQSAFNRFNK